MTDMLKTGTQWLADQLMTHAAELVEYWRSGCEPMPLKASTGRTLFKVEEDGVQKVVWTDKDFIFRAADLALAGIDEPLHGDRIREVTTLRNRMIVRFYLVAAPGGEQPYRNADGRDVITRVHTKLISEEPVV
ncbi:MAG: hypothetical protein SGI77_24415 [Pirellulaceae bacterium]|nr:hypothetical protein [Pirellulaceae bacterium]